MRCEAARPLLYLLEDELDGLESAQLAAHLAECEECRAAREEGITARDRLLVGAIPPMPASVDLRRRRVPRARWPRFALASAAALLLVAAAWLDAPRASRPAVPAETLQVHGFRFAADARVEVVDRRDVQRVRAADQPDASWSLLRGELATSVEPGRYGLGEPAWEIRVGDAPPAAPPRYGRVESDSWRMADLVVRTSLRPEEGAPVDPRGWKTQLRIGED